MVPDIEKAILKSDIGITPASTGDLIRVPLPALTEENRRDLARQAKQEAENARIAVRNIRRDSINHIRNLLKTKEVTEDEARRGEDRLQSITDEWVSHVDSVLMAKESDLMKI